MAAGKRIAGITIEIDGDTTELESALKKVNDSLRDSQNQLRDIDKLLKLDPGNVELLQQKFKALDGSITQTKEKLKTLNNAQAQMQSEGKAGTAEYDALQREIVETEQSLRSLTQEYEKFGSVQAQQVAAAGEKMKEFGGKIEGAGRAVLPVSAAVAGLGIAAIKTGADFDAAMSQVAAVSGAAGEDFTALRDKAIEMGGKTKFSASEAAEALNYMAMAGWKTGDMLGGIEGIMSLAAASGEDLARTSDIVTDALTAFGLTVADSGHFADILAAASSNANTNVGMMGETFKYVAPVAGALGYSAEDTALAIGLMANSGIKASQAGTSLRGAMTRLAKPTGDMVGTMVSLGLAVEQTANVIDEAQIDKLQGQVADKTASMQRAQISYNSAVAKYGESSAQAQKAAVSLETAKRKLAEATEKLGAAQAGTNEVIGITNTLMTDGKGNMNSFESVILRLRESFKSLTAEEQAQAAATLFGQEAMSGMLAIINASDADFEKLSGAIQGCEGSAEEMAAIMQDNMQGQIVLLKSALETLGIKVNDTLLPLVKGIVSATQKLVDWLNGMDEGTQRAVVGVGLFVAALGPCLIIVGKLTSAFGTVMTLAPKIAGAFVSIGGAIGNIIGRAAGASSSLSTIGSAAGSAAAPAAGAGKAIGTLSQNALGFIALGAGILLAAAGLALMAKAAIELGQAGAPAAVAMGAMVAVIALLAAGAAALGPALTAGAVGMAAFGAAVALVGVGVLAASAGLTMLAGQLPTIAGYGSAAALAIAQLGAALAVFAAGALAAAAGATALGAGLVVVAAGAAAVTVAAVALAAGLGVLTVAVLAITATITAMAAAVGVLSAAIVGLGAAVKTATGLVISSFSQAKQTAMNTLNGIKNAFTSTFNSVKSFMSGVISWLKGIFNFKWELPKIKLPHFKISGSFSLNPPSVPSFGIDWYKKAMKDGMILNSPTIFGMSGGRLLGGGEAGAEAVVGVDSLRGMITSAVAAAGGGGGDIIIPVYVGRDRIDEVIVNSTQRANYRSGGR